MEFMAEPQTYYFLAASQQFLCEQEPLAESLREREKNYRERNKVKDFWFVKSPAFLNAPSMVAIKHQCPQPCAAVISTDANVIRWLKLRLEFVVTGEFLAPSPEIPDAIASLETEPAI